MATEKIVVELDTRTLHNLRALTGGRYGPETVQGVIGKLVDHANQGVYRPGAWERDWLCSAFGYDWTEGLETDPRPDHHMFQRPRGDELGGRNTAGQ
jgi:hypothetical protein